MKRIALILAVLGFVLYFPAMMNWMQIWRMSQAVYAAEHVPATKPTLDMVKTDITDLEAEAKELRGKIRADGDHIRKSREDGDDDAAWQTVKSYETYLETLSISLGEKAKRLKQFHDK